MPLALGDILADEGAVDTAVRGTRYTKVLTMYENAGTTANCAGAVLGATDFVEVGQEVVSGGIVLGTGTEIAVRGGWADRGSETEAARLIIVIEPEDLERAFDTGALRQIDLDFAIDTAGVKEFLLSMRLNVEDSSLRP